MGRTFGIWFPEAEGQALCFSLTLEGYVVHPLKVSRLTCLLHRQEGCGCSA